MIQVNKAKFGANLKHWFEQTTKYLTLTSIGLMSMTSMAYMNGSGIIPEHNRYSVQSRPPLNNKKPKVVALAPHIVEMLYAIGAGEQIVGTTDHADYPSSAKLIPRIANHAGLQIERFIEINPDLIIAWQSGNRAEDLNKLKSLGFKVVYSQPNTLLDVANELLTFGRLTNNARQARLVAELYTKQLEQLQSQYQHKRKVSVFYQAWGNPLSTIAKGAWPQLHLDLCGASNPFYQGANAYPSVSIEQVIKQDIELIITPVSGGQNEHNKAKPGYDWTPWTILKAVKHQQFISPNADILHRMTPRVLDEIAYLCKAIDQTRQFYIGKAQNLKD